MDKKGPVSPDRDYGDLGRDAVPVTSPDGIAHRIVVAEKGALLRSGPGGGIARVLVLAFIHAFVGDRSKERKVAVFRARKAGYESRLFKQRVPSPEAASALVEDLAAEIRAGDFRWHRR